MRVAFPALLVAIFFLNPLARAQTVVENPTVTQTIVQPLGTTLAVNFINGTVEADQFCGQASQPACTADMCQKVRAAEAYAILHNLPIVDATHFTGVQTCTLGTSADDMFGMLNTTIAAPLNLDVKFGSVHIQTATQQTITNSALTIEGAGPMQTIIEYTGVALSAPGAVLYASAQSSGVTNGLEDVVIRGIFFLGGNANNPDGLLLRDVNRSLIDNVAAWGASSNGIHAEGCVTTTFIRPKVSQRDYDNLQGITGTHTTPNVGINLDISTASSSLTTDGTVIDAAAEFVAGIGWKLLGSNSMTFTSGTSEHNGDGIYISSSSNYNTFIGSDLEGNSGYDVLDDGKSSIFRNIISADKVGTGGVTLAGNWASWEGGSLEVGQVTNTGAFSSIKLEGQFSDTASVWHQNLGGNPALMPFSGSTFFAGGIGGFNATGIGGELDLFTSYIGAAQDVGIWRNTSSGYVEDAALGPLNSFPAVQISTKIVNQPGLQSVSTNACSITAGAIGNSCSLTLTFSSSGGVAEPDGAYKPVCQALGGTGLWTVGNITAANATNLVVHLVALSTTGTSTGGSVVCTLTHL